jgi:long-chain acyl-CoA synthetase
VTQVTDAEVHVRDVAAERRQVDEAVAGQTLCSAFAAQEQAGPDLVCMEQRQPDGSWTGVTRAAYRSQVRDVALALLADGFAPGQFGVVMGSNRLEHVVADYAVLHARGASVSVYNTSSPEQIAYIAGHCGATVAFLEDETYLARLRVVREQLPALRRVVLMEGRPADDERDWVVGWDDWVRSGQSHPDPDAFDRSWQAVEPDDLASLIYTSGTTGDPKGVMYSHRIVLWTCESFALRLGAELAQDLRAVSYLPLAHVSERFGSHWLGTWLAAAHGSNGVVRLCPDLAQIAAYVGDTRPTLFTGVPRVWEKFAAGLQAGLRALPDEIRTLVEGAMAAGRAAAELRGRGEPVPLEVAAAEEQAAPVLTGVRAKLGLDACRLAVTSTAPVPYDLEMFWAGLGLPLNGVWGMSELTGPASMNPLDDVRPGTAGTALPGVELRIAEDGELLVRGGNVMVGYYRDEVRTAETLDADGWLHSGDVAELDADGYVRIVDRKKELIITSSGKNISPANIEALLKVHPLVGQAMALGDGHSYVTALLVLDAEAAPAWAAARGIAGSAAELAEHPEVLAAVAEGVAEANSHLSRIEQVKRWRVLPDEWTAEGGELTATQKLRRRVVVSKYAEAAEALYAEQPVGAGVTS